MSSRTGLLSVHVSKHSTEGLFKNASMLGAQEARITQSWPADALLFSEFATTRFFPTVHLLKLIKSGATVCHNTALSGTVHKQLAAPESLALT